MYMNKALAFIVSVLMIYMGIATSTESSLTMQTIGNKDKHNDKGLLNSKYIRYIISTVPIKVLILDVVLPYR